MHLPNHSLIFGAFEHATPDERDFIVHIPQAISDPQHLFDMMEQALSLPAYFGRNWDGLEECLADLEWIDARRVILVHEDLPELPPTALKVYVHILDRATRETADRAPHLLVVFPEQVKARVTALL